MRKEQYGSNKGEAMKQVLSQAFMDNVKDISEDEL